MEYIPKPFSRAVFLRCLCRTVKVSYFHTLNGHFLTAGKQSAAATDSQRLHLGENWLGTVLLDCVRDKPDA
jgi:hypothetical protein